MDIFVAAHPRTFTFAAFAASHTGMKRSILSAIEQLMFFLLNASEAAPKIATSVAPTASAASKPYQIPQITSCKQTVKCKRHTPSDLV
jgi:hypothetical protein